MRLIALIRKEALLLSRDPHALGALFVMPTLFILLMAFALSAVNQDQLPALHVALETGQPSADSAFFTAALQDQLEGGHVERGEAPGLPVIRLPADFSDTLLDTEQSRIELLFPPAADSVLRQRLRAAARTAFAQTRLQAFLQENGDLSPDEVLEDRLATVQERSRTQIDERELTGDGDAIVQANATQHSVPAWLIFGMFFVMLPMAHGFQRERESGVLLRLRCLGLATAPLALGKLAPYLALNLVQFALFLCLGVWGLPLMGLPGLVLTGSATGYALLAVSIAFAACSLGLAIAMLCRSTEQALLVSAGTNIVLAAIGGVMVPRSVMPDAMRQLAEISPMSWALDAFLALLVGQGNASSVLPFCGRLALFGLIIGVIALFLFRKRLNDTQWTTRF